MPRLTQEQIDQFWRDGCITIENAVSPEQLAALRQDFASWVEESRSHNGAYGEMMDGRPRFDVEPGHSADQPALRRVASPTELSEAYLDVITNSAMVEMIADLIGPDLRLHHSKINSKLPGSATTVKWHQDFNFDPHSNDDLVTALLFMDDVTEENGPLETVSASHKGPIYSLWQDGVFTGAINEETSAELQKQAEIQTGPAGSVCLMHGRLAHASAANKSLNPRTLFISVIAAADAIPLTRNPVPSVHAGMLLCGEEPGRIRSTAFDMEMPEVPDGASFFVQQAVQ